MAKIRRLARKQGRKAGKYAKKVTKGKMKATRQMSVRKVNPFTGKSGSHTVPYSKVGK